MAFLIKPTMIISTAPPTPEPAMLLWHDGSAYDIIQALSSEGWQPKP
jgi:hypothetical protein